MSFGPNDSGLLPFKSEAETEEYLDELGLKFRYACTKEKDPIQCHSLGLWLETFKRNWVEAESIYRDNCFTRRFPESCTKYAFLKLFGGEGITRDKQLAFEALKFGCHVAGDARCCQTAGEQLLDGVIPDNENFDQAAEFFKLGSQRGLPVSSYYLGSLYYARAQRQRSADIRQSGSVSRPRSEAELQLRKNALQYWVTACEKRHELACRNVARAYHIGDAVEKDEELSAKYMKLAENINSRGHSTGDRAEDPT
nr:unnamed protein product [Spirometra erinaceieuropaei]